ncbi:MAG: hypothetical protein Q4F00_08465 [bacterium]|nr:hypothetical protein [bacterium]
MPENMQNSRSQNYLSDSQAPLLVAPFCRNLMAYCRSHRLTSELCRSHINSETKGNSLKWVTTLTPWVALNAGEIAGKN